MINLNRINILLILKLLLLHNASSEDILDLIRINIPKLSDRSDFTKNIKFPSFEDWSNNNELSKTLNNPESQKIFESVTKKIQQHNSQNFQSGASHVFCRVPPKIYEMKAGGGFPNTGFKVDKSKMVGRPKRFLGFMACPNTVLTNYALPKVFSWRSVKDFPVMDQGDTGACWAMSAAQCLQYFLLKNYNITTPLSTQQACDCCPNANCVDGGFITDFCDMCMNSGATSEKAYPFTGKQSTCKLSNSMSKVMQSTFIRSYCFFNTANETQLMYMIHQNGPVTAAIFTSFDVFWNYGGGIITPTDCGQSGSPDHAVLIVGFGTCPVTGLPYWECKNSWGVGWGEGGYFRVKRGVNCCAIMDYPEAFVIPKK